MEDPKTSNVAVEAVEEEPSPEPASGVRAVSFASMLVEAGMLSSEQASTAQEAAWREKLSLSHVQSDHPGGAPVRGRAAREQGALPRQSGALENNVREGVGMVAEASFGR